MKSRTCDACGNVCHGCERENPHICPRCGAVDIDWGDETDVPQEVATVARALNKAKGYDVAPDTAEIRAVHASSWAEASVAVHELRQARMLFLATERVERAELLADLVAFVAFSMPPREGAASWLRDRRELLVRAKEIIGTVLTSDHLDAFRATHGL